MYLDPHACLPPHRVTHPDKLEGIIASMEQEGWNGEKLIGYVNGRYVQLLSGSHRWAGAIKVGVKIPTILRSKSQVEDAFGNLEAWQRVMSQEEKI